MALTVIDTALPASQRTSQEQVKQAARELQGLRQVVVQGAGANADIAVAGAAVGDVIVGVVESNAGALTDRTGVSTFSAAGILHVNAVTTGHGLIVTYIHLP